MELELNTLQDEYDQAMDEWHESFSKHWSVDDCASETELAHARWAHQRAYASMLEAQGRLDLGRARAALEAERAKHAKKLEAERAKHAKKLEAERAKHAKKLETDRAEIDTLRVALEETRTERDALRVALEEALKERARV
jgi:predicted RNase H-like nuclease (RuvC/YqgF family)